MKIREINFEELQRKAWINGEWQIPHDNSMKRLKMRPNYKSEQANIHGDCKIVRLSGKSSKVIYECVGKADAPTIVKELHRQAQEHFSITLGVCTWDSYHLYSIVDQSVYDCARKIEQQDTIYGFPFNNNLGTAYARRLMTWYGTSYLYPRDKHYDLLKIYVHAAEHFDKHRHQTFEPEPEPMTDAYRAEVMLYNSTLYTLQFIREHIAKIKLYERLAGYYA